MAVLDLGPKFRETVLVHDAPHSDSLNNVGLDERFRFRKTIYQLSPLGGGRNWRSRSSAIRLLSLATFSQRAAVDLLGSASAQAWQATTADRYSEIFFSCIARLLNKERAWDGKSCARAKCLATGIFSDRLIAATFALSISGDSKRLQMRLTLVCLMAVVMMPVCRGAVADIRADCARLGENFANTNVKDVNLWLGRYRQTYARCLAGHGITDESSTAAGKLNESVPEEVGNKITTVKSANPKAVFRNPVVKQVVKPIQKPLNISKIEQRPSALTRKLKNPARSKKTTKIKVVPAKKPFPLSLPARSAVDRKGPIKSVGADGWRINCSPRFGGWDKVSDWYISTAGKRVSCAIRP